VTFADKLAGERSLVDILATLKFAASSMDFAGALAALKAVAGVTRTHADSQMLRSDPNFSRLTQVVKAHLGQTTPSEASEAVFVIRRCFTGSISLGLGPADTDILRRRIGEFVEDQQYNLRQLAGLYFNYSMINWNPEKVVVAMNKLLEQNPTQVTEVFAAQCTSAANIKKGKLSQSERQLVDTICKNHQLYYEQLDYRRKTELFKSLAGIEFTIQHHGRFGQGALINVLRRDLRANIDKLGEKEVLNIVEAYVGLPGSYPSDLIDDFRKMVLATLEHNALNLKSFFLIAYLEKQIDLPRYSPMTQTPRSDSRRPQQDLGRVGLEVQHRHVPAEVGGPSHPSFERVGHQEC
jgi:hypothetical protein